MENVNQVAVQQVPMQPTLTQASISASDKLITDGKPVAAKTYANSSKNSTFIMPSGKVLQFKQTGNGGHLTTTDPYEQAELDAAIKVGAHIWVLGVNTPAIQRKEASTAQIVSEALEAAGTIIPDVSQIPVNTDAIAIARAKLMAINNGKPVELADGEEIKGGVATGAINSMSNIAKAASPSISK